MQLLVSLSVEGTVVKATQQEGLFACLIYNLVSTCTKEDS